MERKWRPRRREGSRDQLRAFLGLPMCNNEQHEEQNKTKAEKEQGGLEANEDAVGGGAKPCHAWVVRC